jgi:hypothetical protein
MKTNTQKRPYKTPKISDVGSVVERTLGGTTGDFLDDSFPVGTPFSELTFS